MFSLPHISDFLATLLIMVGAGVVIILPATFFGGKAGAVITVAVLTGFSCFALVYAKGMGRAFYCHLAF